MQQRGIRWHREPAGFRDVRDTVLVNSNGSRINIKMAPGGMSAYSFAGCGQKLTIVFIHQITTEVKSARKSPGREISKWKNREQTQCDEGHVVKRTRQYGRPGQQAPYTQLAAENGNKQLKNIPPRA